MVTICRPFITLRNGTVLYAASVGKRAFCFDVDEEKPKKAKDPSKDESDAK